MLIILFNILQRVKEHHSGGTPGASSSSAPPQLQLPPKNFPFPFPSPFAVPGLIPSPLFQNVPFNLLGMQPGAGVGGSAGSRSGALNSMNLNLAMASQIFMQQQLQQQAKAAVVAAQAAAAAAAAAAASAPPPAPPSQLVVQPAPVIPRSKSPSNVIDSLPECAQVALAEAFDAASNPAEQPESVFRPSV